MDVKCNAEFVGRREIQGSLSVKTISEYVRVLYVSALQKGSNTITRKLSKDSLQISTDGLHISGIFKSTLTDIVFSHIDDKNKRLIVLVLRLKNNECKDFASTRLEAHVWKCQTAEDSAILCRKIHEFRQNEKLKKSNKVSKPFESQLESNDCASVSSDSAIESASCPSSVNSPNTSSDECSESMTSETPSEHKIDNDSDDSALPGPSKKKESFKRRAPDPPVKQGRLRSRSVPAARILLELIDKDGMEHKQIVNAEDAIDCSSENENDGSTICRSSASGSTITRESRPRQKECALITFRKSSKFPEEKILQNTFRKLRSSPKYSGIVSFSTHDRQLVVNQSLATKNVLMYPTKSAFDPKNLTQAMISQKTLVFHPAAANLDYKQWRKVTGLDQARDQQSPLAKMSRHLSDSKRSLINALKRPLVLRRSNSLMSRMSFGSESCISGQLRSVMKKGTSHSGIDFGNIDGHGDKKNVTFNALTRVQVVDCR